MSEMLPRTIYSIKLPKIFENNWQAISKACKKKNARK